MPHQVNRSSTPHEVLYARVREWKYCDVLIDCMAGFPFQEELDALGDQIVPRFLLNDPIFAKSPTQAPLLVRLPWTQGELLEKYLTYAVQEAADPDAQTRSVCAFLFSPLEQSKLGKLMTRRLDIPVQTIGNIYFRYVDPRVTHHLSRILDSNQLSSLLQGIQTWLYVDWGGQLNAPTVKFPGVVSKLFLTATQWQQMQDIEAFNLGLRHLRRADYIDATSALEIETRLFAAVRDAVMAGLSMPEDQGVYAAYAVEYGKDFALHPRLPDALNAVTQHKVRFADALEAYVGITPPFISLSKIS